LPNSVAKNLHREALTVRETAEFNSISCQSAEKFVTSSFPNMSKADIAKAHLERALLQFNKNCSVNNRYPAKWAEFHLSDLKSGQLDSDGLDLLDKIHRSPAFMFNQYNKRVSVLLVMLLVTLFVWVSFRRDYGKEKKPEAEVANSTTPETQQS